MAMCRCAHLAAGDDSALSGCYESSFIEDTPSPVADQGRRGDVVEPPRFVAQVTECRANPVVSRRGYLLVTDATDDAAASPVKRWVVSVHTSFVTFNSPATYFTHFSIRFFVVLPCILVLSSFNPHFTVFSSGRVQT